MRKMQKVVLIFMGIFSMILASACGDQDKEAVEKIEQALKEKYGEEFTVEKIGGGYGTVTTNTLKAIVSPEAAPEKEFDVEITKDLDKVFDRYMNVIMSEKLDVVATEMAHPIVGQEIWVKTNISSRGISFPDSDLNNKNMDIKQYLESQSKVAALINVFIKSDGNIDLQKEAERLSLYADELIEYGTKNANISVYYIDQEMFGRIENEYQVNKDSVFKYFSEDGRSYYTSWVRIDNSQKEQSADGILKNFSAKRNQ